MDENEEAFIESMAFIGSLHDTAVRIVINYPDLPEEVMTFIKTMVEMFEYNENNLLERPDTVTYIKKLIEDS